MLWLARLYWLICKQKWDQVDRRIDIAGPEELFYTFPEDVKNKKGVNILYKGHGVLHAAVLFDAPTDIVAKLLKKGLKVDKVDDRGITSLHYANMPLRCNPETVKLLLQAGADPIAKTKSGRTALDFAKMGHNNPEVIRLLTQASQAKLIPPQPPSPPQEQQRPKPTNSKPAAQKPIHKYLLFFSYAQKDTLAETTLLAKEAQTKFPGARIFRDADHHFKLTELVQHVSNAKNVVILLSGNYPKRPFTLIELHTALKCGAHVVAVKPTRPGLEEFDFERTREDIESGAYLDYLDDKGWAILEENGVSPQDVAEDLLQAMNTIARPYSIAYSSNVQASMAEDILSSLQL